MAESKPAKFRTLAAQARREAEDSRDAASKRELLEIAQRYEKLADWAERQGSTDKSGG